MTDVRRQELVGKVVSATNDKTITVLVDPPKQRITNTSRAPVLSATFNLDSCITIRLPPIE